MSDEYDPYGGSYVLPSGFGDSGNYQSPYYYDDYGRYIAIDPYSAAYDSPPSATDVPQGDYYPVYAPPPDVANDPLGGDMPTGSPDVANDPLGGDMPPADGGGGGGGGGGGNLGNLLRRFIFKPDGSIDPAKIAMLGAGAMGIRSLLGAKPNVVGPQGFTGTIPTRTLVRERVPYAEDPTRRPGSAGRKYFTRAQYVAPAEAAVAREAAKAEARGIAGLAAGGMAQGRYLGGPTDGMADKLPANIDGKQEARLSHGEFVIPADVVSHLGNGNSEAGAQRLYDMMDKIRKARTGTPKQGKQINPDKYMPK